MASYSSNGASHGSGNHGSQDSSSQGVPDYNLSGVLHFLQSEWRRYEHDRNTWAIERAELRARIALLEGERRSVENLKTDLLRRIKMLELALRQERMKSVPNGSSSATSTVTNKMLERVASTSHSEDMQESTKLSSRAATPVNNVVKLPMGVKDARGRAKSREFLQQCLQEIAYLTSHATLNPITPTTDPTNPDAASHPPRPEFHVAPLAATTQEDTFAPSQMTEPRADAAPAAPTKEANAAHPMNPTQPSPVPSVEVMPVSHSGDETLVQQPDQVPDVQLWHPHGSFSSHLDSVRALMYDGSGEGLFTASDDCTIKYWRMLPTATTQNDPTKPVAEPLTTLRGHQAAVTCLAYSKVHNILYSGSLDATVRQWSIPSVTPAKGETVSPCLSSVLPGTDQAVWGLALFPSHGQEDMLLVSVSASGTMHLWNTGEREPQLLLSWDYFGTNATPEAEEERKSMSSMPVPTSVTKCPANLRACVVSFSNGVVKLYNLSDGQELQAFKPPSGSQAQANMVVGHPTLPLVAAAHEDNCIHVYDIRENTCVLSLHAHRDSVTCLDIDPSGLTFVSGSHNGTVRFWDLMKTGDMETTSSYQAKCFQEVQAHEVHAKEGVLAVAYHPSSPLVATAGADGAVRMYG